jgi:hypothetical protein
MKVLAEEPGGGDHLEELGIDGRVILNRNLDKSSEIVWSGFIWLIGTR